MKMLPLGFIPFFQLNCSARMCLFSSGCSEKKISWLVIKLRTNSACWGDKEEKVWVIDGERWERARRERERERQDDLTKL